MTTARIFSLFAAVAVALALLVQNAPVTTAAPGDAPTPTAISNEPHLRDGLHVALVGDSISLDALGPISAELAPAALDARTWPGAKSYELVDAAKDLASQDPDVAVIHLGSNDVAVNRPPAEIEDTLRSIGEQFPRRTCVVFTTVNGVNPDDRFAGDVAAMDSWVRRQPIVADWDAANRAAQLEDWPEGDWTKDLVHPTPLGQQKLAELTRAAVDRCVRTGLVG